MPEFVRPKRAIIETGGTGKLVALAGLALLGLTLAGLVAFIVAHIVLIACCLAATGALAAAIIFWMVWVSSPKRLRRAGVLPSQQLAPVRQLPATVRALPRPARALPPPAQHFHLHLHGVTAEDAAAITQAARKETR